MVKCKAVIDGIIKMNDNIIHKLTDLIKARLCALNQEDALGEQGQATVKLDQQAIGRLSRMDALQNQAMSKATSTRRAQERTRLNAAINRLQVGEYGYCEDCGENIAIARLTLDPTVVRCVECVKG